MREVAEVQKEIDAVKGTSKMPQVLTELGSARDSIYDAFDQSGVPPKEEPKEPEPQKVEAEPKKETEPEKAEFVPDKPKDEEKTVPYGALKEEREKRKELARKIKELEDSFKQAAEDNKKLVELMSSKSDDEPITDYEKEMLNLRKQIKLQQAELENLKRGQEQRSKVTEEQRITELVKSTDAELAKDGFEGFDDFVPQVIKAMNDEEIPMEERDPSTWKRVYKEIVFPKYVGKYKVIQKEDKKAEKEANKKEAALVKSPGKAVEPKKEDDDDSPESYTKWRQKQSFFHNPL
jgi:hypothetical protein